MTCKDAKHIISECPECKSHIIVNDTHHDVIYCFNCGLVLLECNKECRSTHQPVKYIYDEKHNKD